MTRFVAALLLAVFASFAGGRFAGPEGPGDPAAGVVEGPRTRQAAWQ